MHWDLRLRTYSSGSEDWSQLWGASLGGAVGVVVFELLDVCQGCSCYSYTISPLITDIHYMGGAGSIIKFTLQTRQQERITEIRAVQRRVEWVILVWSTGGPNTLDGIGLHHWISFNDSGQRASDTELGSLKFRSDGAAGKRLELVTKAPG
jgi:hypothetical protein